MKTLRRQRGNWAIVSAILLVIGAFDVFFSVIGIFQRRRITDTSGMETFEPALQYRRRIVRSVSPHVIVWGLLLGGFWAIVHFGPLRPVHEWFR